MMFAKKRKQFAVIGFFLIFSGLTSGFLVSSCTDPNRSNPLDPLSTNNIAITFPSPFGNNYSNFFLFPANLVLAANTNYYGKLILGAGHKAKLTAFSYNSGVAPGFPTGVGVQESSSVSNFQYYIDDTGPLILMVNTGVISHNTNAYSIYVDGSNAAFKSVLVIW